MGTDELQKEIEENTKVWHGKGRPPKSIAAKVKQQTVEKKSMRIRKSRTGNLIVNKDADLEKFLEEFFANGGNATQAALTIGNYTNIKSATTAGSNYLRKAKNMGIVRTMLERKGFGQGKMLDVAIDKMIESKTPEWWDRLMKMAEYEDFITKKEFRQGPSVVNVIGAQRAISKSFGFNDAEVVDGETNES